MKKQPTPSAKPNRSPQSPRVQHSVAARPRIHVMSAGKAFAAAASAIAGTLKDAIRRKGIATLALAGGRSAQSLCAQLARRSLDWGKIHIFMIDERLVPITDELSNFNLINRELIRKVRIPRANVHPFVHDPQQLDEGASRYAAELALVGGMFDAIFVSAGEDGHIAGLYPHHYLLDNVDGFFAAFHDSPKPPADRITALPRNFVAAGCSVLLVLGEGKRAALEAIKSPRRSVLDCPAKLVTRSHSYVIVTDIK